MLYGQALPKNAGEKFEDIEGKIDSTGTSKDTANVIAKYREEIKSVLQSEEAIGKTDEKTLKNLIDKLWEKSLELQTNLGKTHPCEIDLTNNNGITNFWEGVVDGSRLTGANVGGDELTNFEKKINEALRNIQFLHDNGKGNQVKSFTLFKGKSTDITNFEETIKDPIIKNLLEEDDSTKVKDHIDKFINSMKHPSGNAFYIKISDKLLDDKQGEVAMRIALFLYCMKKVIKDGNLKKDLYDRANKILDEQIIKEEIPKLKGLHNTKVELGYLEPEYETLMDLNTKSGDIDLGTHNLKPTKQSFEKNLTPEYEAGIARNIEKYELKKSDVKVTDAAGATYAVSFLDAMGKPGDLTCNLSDTKNVNFHIEVGGHKIKIGRFVLSNLAGDAKFKIEIDDEATIQAAFTAAGVSMPAGQLDFEIPVKGIKNVSNGLSGCKAALTKKVKIALIPSVTPPPPPPPPPPPLGSTFDVEASLSNVTEVSREEAERVAEEQLRERLENIPRYSPDRINLFFRRDYIKEKYVRKIMKGEKGFSWKDRDVNATDRQQIQNSQEKIFDEEIETKDVQTECPNTYVEIDNLCKSFTGTAPTFLSTMTDDQFQKKFSDIINADPPYDKPSIVEVIGKERALTYSSNILIRLHMFMDHQKMVNNIHTYITSTTPPHTDVEIDTYSRTEIKKYMDTYNNIPNFLQSLGTTLDDPNFLIRLKGSSGALTTIATQTMKLKMNIIKKGSAAYKIKQKRGFIAKTGDVLDSGFSKKRKKEMPLRLLETCGWARGLGRTGLVMGAGIGGGLLLGPLGTAIGAGTAVGLRTLFSKYSHYTKEHEGQMKNEAVDRAKYEAERSRLQAAVGGKKWYQVNRLRGKDRKDARHRNRYVRTTHGRSENTLKLASNISALANKETTLTAPEIDQLKDLVSEGFARLIYYKRKGQNFLGSDDVNKAEEDYRNLYAKLIAGANRVGWVMSDGKIDKTEIQHYSNYTTTMNSIRSGYNEARKRFKGKRAALGRGNAVVTGAVAGGLSYVFAKAGRTRVGKGDEHNFINPGDAESTLPMTHIEKGGGNHTLHEVFQNAMASKPHATGYDLYVSPEIDGLTTGVNTSHTYSSLTDKIANIRATIPASDTKTLESFDKAMTLHSTMPPRYKRSALEKAIAYASNHGADVGNQYLFGERFAETVKDTLAARVSAGTENIPIDRIGFGRFSANATASVPGSTGNILERSMNGILKIKGGIGVGVPVSRNTFKRHEGNVKPTSTATP